MKTKTIVTTVILLIGIYITLTNLVVVVTTAASLVGLIFRSLWSGDFGQFFSHGVTLAVTSSSLITGLILVFLARTIANFVLRMAKLDGEETREIGHLQGAAIISIALLGLFLIAQNLGGVLGGSLEFFRAAIGSARSLASDTCQSEFLQRSLMTQYATRLIACGIGLLLVMSPHRLARYILRKADG